MQRLWPDRQCALGTTQFLLCEPRRTPACRGSPTGMQSLGSGHQFGTQRLSSTGVVLTDRMGWSPRVRSLSLSGPCRYSILKIHPVKAPRLFHVCDPHYHGRRDAGGHRSPCGPCPVSLPTVPGLLHPRLAILLRAMQWIVPDMPMAYCTALEEKIAQATELQQQIQAACQAAPASTATRFRSQFEARFVVGCPVRCPSGAVPLFRLDGQRRYRAGMVGQHTSPSTCARPSGPFAPHGCIGRQGWQGQQPH